MGEMRHCPSCGEVFNYNGLRDICAKCAMNEEKMYEIVYRFMRRRENRAATVEQIVENTGVEEELIYKWVRKGRLQPGMFPNLGYPCDKCGRITNKGRLCARCTEELESDLRTFDAAKEFRDKMSSADKGTYHSGIDKK